MFQIRGTPTVLQHGLSRRDLLRLSLAAGPALLAPAIPAAAAPRSFGRAKSVIFLYLFGGPSHLDMWDMKPEAPAQIRGEFQPIVTDVPGIRITEHMPRLARRMRHGAIIRSLTHGDGSHGSASHTMLTGRRPKALGEVAPTPDDFPNLASVLDHLRGPGAGGLPTVALPWTIATSTNVVPGQDGGFLGHGCDPFRLQPAAAVERGFEVPLAAMPAAASADRLRARRRLLEQLGDRLEALPAARDVGRLYDRAFDLLVSPRFWQAFNLGAEPAALRERYGMNTFGQGVLLARRLVEAGAPAITVFWPDRSEPEAFINNGVKDSVAVAAWDTHGWKVGNTPNFPRLKDHNLPPLDIALSSLLDDLAERGLLDQTLVVVTGEFGRSPQINRDGGRDHYGHVFSALLAGGGVRGGQVYGASDATGAFPAEDPVTPGDFAATLYHCLGIPPATEIRDRMGRPYAIAEGEPLTRLLG